MADKTSLFSISCDTCAARLTVRNESAIGQVLACPRCGSMVMVDPPEGWVAPEGDPLPPLPRRPRDPNDSQATLSNEFGDLRSETTPSRPASRSTPKRPLAPPVQHTESGPILPDGKWDSSQSVERRKILAWIASIVGICLIALAAIVWLMVSMTGGGEIAQAAGDNGLNPVNLEDSPDDESKVASIPGEEPAIEPDTASENPDVNPNLPGPAADNGPKPEAKKADADAPHDEPLIPDDSSDDPLADIDLATEGSSTDKAMTIDDGTVQQSFIEEVSPLEELFTDPGMGAALDFIGESRQESLIGLGKIFVPRPRPIKLDFEKQLNESFPQVQFDRVPLAEFVRILNSISGIPIYLDTHSVTYGHLRPLEEITYTGTEQSVVSIINNALQSYSLVATPNPENNVLVIASKDNDVFAERKLMLDPALVGDEAQRELLAALITTVTGPERWNIGEIPSRIRISKTEVTIESTGILYDEVRFILNKLAAAARLNTNPEDVSGQEVVRSYWTESVPVLEATCTLNEIQLKPANWIMNQVARNEKLVVLEDWGSLVPEGWTPDTQMPWPGDDSTVEETLTDITTSMGVAWRLLGPATVQITSRDQYRNGTRFEVYPCAQVLQKHSIEQVMKILQSQLYSDVQRTKSWTRVDYFPPCNCIVAQLPDPLQIRFESILTELAR